RAHASTHGLARELPAMAGLLMHREIAALSELRDGPESPYVAVIGGAKISDKLSVCRRLLDRVDVLIVGGGLANTFLLTMGYDVGNSLVEPEMVREVRALIAEASRKKVDLMMPLDVMVANTISPSATTRTVEASSVPRGWSIVDIGPRTVARYSTPLATAKTIFWNGPMGVMEVPAFSRGTEGIARAIAAQSGARTVAGGGESVEMLSRLKLIDRLDHVSTGGGAALQYLAGDSLPALSLLERTGTRRRRPWVGGNWKMSVPGTRARVLASAVAEGVRGDEVDVAIFPSYTQLEGVGREIRDSRVTVGGQDCHWETEGSFTSGVSGAMLSDSGARCTLVGHSECRRYLGDDNERVAKKLRAALASNLVAILCIGEDSRAGEDGGWNTIERQLHRALDGLPGVYGNDYPWGRRLLLAYEPVWAIGSGEPASPEIVAETTYKIREELGHIFDPWAAENIRLVYGGSVNAENAADFVALPSVDGVLVGGASTSAESFLGIVDAIRGLLKERDE
ncbi:MAG: triose-phosphate isomerase, partial [Bacillota bacterium]